MRGEGDTFALGTSRLLDGSLLGSSGQTAHSLIGGSFLGSLPVLPLVCTEERR